jgi:glycosyltransferase involved in cell wall biosynthesis
MRILWYNWRDIKNPDAGGAEVFTHEICKRLRTRGGVESITLFASSFQEAESEEIVDGVRIVRAGDKYSVYKKARDFYVLNHKSFDVVIDEINTKPFDTPSFVKDKPILALVHQLAREFWFYETRFPINLIGYLFLEKYWLRKYHGIPTITVSVSTQDDLRGLGFKQVFIVPEGIGFRPLERPAEKETLPTVLFIGRLKKAKKPHDAIKAFKIIKDEIPHAKLWIVGDGYMLNELKEMTYRLFGSPHGLPKHSVVRKLFGSRREGTANNEGDNGKSESMLMSDSGTKTPLESLETGESVRFFGKIGTPEKLELMARAHVLLVPGVREGWGLVVTEANAMGTPAVAYDVPGLRDSVRDDITGTLVQRDDIVGMAIEAVELLRNQSKRVAYSQNALKTSRNYDWNITTDRFFEVLKSIGAPTLEKVGGQHAA